MKIKSKISAALLCTVLLAGCGEEAPVKVEPAVPATAEAKVEEKVKVPEKTEADEFV